MAVRRRRGHQGGMADAKHVSGGGEEGGRGCAGVELELCGRVGVVEREGQEGAEGGGGGRTGSKKRRETRLWRSSRT